MIRVLMLFLIGSSLATRVRYDGYKVLRVHPRNERQMRIVEDLQNTASLDFWGPNDVMVSPAQETWVTNLLDNNGIQYNVRMQDVQALIDQQVTRRGEEDDVTANFYTEYHTYDEITKWVKDKPVQYPELATDYAFDLTSYEGRDLHFLKIGAASATEKPVIWFEACVHSREWIAPATAMFITDKFLQDYYVDPEVRTILDTFDLYVHPLMNPDGYEYTREVDRMWRKTRSPNNGSTCIGKDGNRNFEYEWGGKGSSGDPCSNNYRGPEPYSEPEVRTVTDYIKDLAANGADIPLFIDFHSSGQIWLLPWSYTGEYRPPSPDYDNMMAMASDGADAIYAVHGQTYTYGSCGEILYEAAGNANDFAYGTMGIPFSYVIELRDTGEYGHLLPQDQIIPTGQEIYAGVRAAIRYLVKNYV